MRWGALVLVALAGCIDSQLVTCPNDELCPVGSLCDTVHGGCISPDQAKACVGIADHEACHAGTVVGYCLDQICVDPGCGNHIVDPGELCDDGNRKDGDGCSATCTSLERCGDGALDPAHGEECDDGNLQSHDGCDSRCLVETAVWTVDDLGPSRAEAHWTIYDPKVGKVVMLANGYLWAWDGAHWSVAATGGPRVTDDYAVTYDSSRGVLVMVAARPPSGDILDPNPPRDQIYEYDGTAWTHVVATTAPSASSFGLTFDSVRGRVFGFGNTNGGNPVAATYDAASHAWTVLPAPAFTSALNTTVAFDKNRGRVVAVASGGTSTALGEWNGTTWGVTSTTMAASSGWSAFYDPSLARVVVVGSNAFVSPTPVQSWSGTAWVDLPSVSGARSLPSAAYDETRNVRVVFGGADVSGYPDAVAEGSGTMWMDIPRTTPPPGADDACAFDEARKRLVCVGPGENYAETWAWTGMWTRLGDVGDTAYAVAYDPVRGGVVTITPGDLRLLGDTSWQATPIATLEDPARSLAFDPRTSQLVASVSQMFGTRIATTLIDEQDQTQSFSSMPILSLAFDARNAAVVGMMSGTAVELGSATWTPIVGPGFGYTAVTDSRRGTVEFVGAPHDVERVGSSWLDLDPSPIQLLGASAFDQSTGELLEIGDDGISRFLLHRQWQSATPFEDCTGSGDLDGDGLSGCDDPDCWTQCHAACPPLTTCP